MKKLLLGSFVGAVCAMGLVACSNDDDGVDPKIPAGQKTKANITVSVGPYGSEETSSDERKSLANVWLLGFDNDGKNVQASKLNSINLDEKVSVEIIAGANMKLVVAANLDATFTQGAMTYNEFTQSAWTGKITSFEAVPLIGETAYTIDEEGKDLPAVTVSQIAAQVSVKIPAIDGYEITSVTLENVVEPYYYYWQGENMYTGQYGVIGLDPAVAEHTVFVGENLTGTVSGISSAKEKVTDKNATCLKIAAVKQDSETTTTAVFTYYFGENETTDFNVKRNHSYSFHYNINLDDASDLRVELNTVGVLKEAAASNSYILSPAAKYTLGIPVSRVNEFWNTSEGGSDKSKVISDGSNGGEVTSWAAKVIASDSDDELINIVIGQGSSADDYVAIEAAGAGHEGNAIVAIYDASKGESAILWSWHIWVTAYNPGGDINGDIPEITETIGQATVPGGKVFRTPGVGTSPTIASTMGMMDRNLGALSATPADGFKTIGAYYQWGRKDAFFMDFDPANINNSYLDNIVEQKASKTQAVENPTTFYAVSGSWQNDDEQYLWRPSSGGAKTLYDPCPAGWRVTPAEEFLGADNDLDNFTTSPASTNGYFAGSVLYSSRGLDVYFPLAGYVLGLTGKASSVGEIVVQWCGYHQSAGNGRMTRVMNPASVDPWEDGKPVYPRQPQSKASGAQVRCVKE